MSQHVARVAKIDRLEVIPGADKIQTAYVLGIQVIVGKDAKLGDVGLLFDGELAVSEAFTKENNLYRHSNLNKDNTKTGYFDDNRKVRVQKFMKVRSEGLFIELTSLSFAGDIFKLKIGDAFDEFNGVKICEKYISAKTRASINSANSKKKKVKTLEAPFFHEHLDSEQFTYYVDKIKPGALITIEHKWHGTSNRSAYTKAKRNLPKWKQFINKFAPIFEIEKWEYVAGSRRVVLFAENAPLEGFHGTNQYRFDILETFKPYLWKNMTIFSEVVGEVNGSAIMPSHSPAKMKDSAFIKKYGNEITYKYGCVQGTYKVKIYRITLNTEDGNELDFSFDQMVKWCEDRGLPVSKPLVPSFIYDGNKEKLTELVKNLADRLDKLTEDYVDPSHINEGCVIRIDQGNNSPLYLKYKSFAFRCLEGLCKEADILDTEEVS